MGRMWHETCGSICKALFQDVVKKVKSQKMANRYKIFLGLAWVSRNNLHHQSNQPPTPAHNHQSTNHEHLQSLTTTIHKLTHLSHSPAGLKVAWLTTLVDVRLSARPSWNSSLPVETQVYLQWYCTSCFQCTLHYLSYVGSPAWVMLNKLPFDSQLPVCLLDQYVTVGLRSANNIQRAWHEG